MRARPGLARSLSPPPGSRRLESAGRRGRGAQLPVHRAPALGVCAGRAAAEFPGGAGAGGDGVRGRWAAAIVTSRGGASQRGRRSAEPRAQQPRPESPRGERNARGPMERYKGEDPSTHPRPGVVAVEGRGDPRWVGGHILAFVSWPAGSQVGDPGPGP